MSEQLRAHALSEAVKHAQGSVPAEHVVTIAETFLPFLKADASDGPNKTSSAAAADPAPKKIAAKKTPLKTRKSEDELAQEALDNAEAEQEDDEPAPAATKEAVGNIVNKLLKAGKRPQALGLLKKFNAASVSGVKPKDFAKFVAEGTKLLGAEEPEEEEADLES
jgi:hypothetical protein